MRRHGWLAGLALAALISGCAALAPPYQPAGGSTAPPPRAATPRPRSGTAPTAAAATTAPAVVDSGPSEDARHVLATIPEPLAPQDRVPAPASAHAGEPAHAAAPPTTSAAPPDQAAPDTSAAPAVEDTSSGETPVPSPTEPLGEKAGGSEPAIPDSVLHPRTLQPPPPSHVRGDTCWRVQIVAPRDKPRADHFRNAATSQLMVVFVVEHESGLYKVRTRDCLDRAEAEAIRTRALQSGFRGAFLSAIPAQ